MAKALSVKRIGFDDYGNISELEFFDSLHVTAEDIAQFIKAYTNERYPKMTVKVIKEEVLDEVAKALETAAIG